MERGRETSPQQGMADPLTLGNPGVALGQWCKANRSNGLRRGPLAWAQAPRPVPKRHPGPLIVPTPPEFSTSTHGRVSGAFLVNWVVLWVIFRRRAPTFYPAYHWKGVLEHLWCAECAAYRMTIRGLGQAWDFRQPALEASPGSQPFDRMSPDFSGRGPLLFSPLLSPGLPVAYGPRT
jgi:hypothetical protein